MPANILVVEDEPAIQELIAVNLEHAGHHVIRSKDAEEALKSEDKAAIEAKTQALAQAAHKLAERMYKEEQAKQPGAEKPADEAKKEEGNVVDAEYTEVKDGKK